MDKDKKSLSIEEINNHMKKFGYTATEELQYNTFTALLNFNNTKNSVAQDIYAVCLEGPPGAGKTEYAKVYTKIVKELWSEEVEFVDYQCDATTGKSELFEDINISAAIRGDADNVNIPGKLIQAINYVNSGKKVILFIDEYDKAREETDAFLLQFLQSGKINSTQHGDIEVKNEYKNNLQVILCKNDVRETLSGPLSRRIRIIRLDYMLPEIFYSVAEEKLITNRTQTQKVDKGILNLVSLMYNNAYDSKEIYNRLPSCSEMLIAIEDANSLVQHANAPQYIVYRTIIENMFKDRDDIHTFESMLEKNSKNNDQGLKDLILEMKNKEEKNELDLMQLISKTIFKNEHKNLELSEIKYNELMEEATSLIEDATSLIEEYEEKFKRIETAHNDLNNKPDCFQINNDLVEEVISESSFLRTFPEETAYIKRGINITDIFKDEFFEISTLSYDESASLKICNQLISNAPVNNTICFEDGFLIGRYGDISLICAREKVEQKEKLTFYVNSFVVPLQIIEDICRMIIFLNEKIPGYYDFATTANVFNNINLDLPLLKDNVYKLDKTIISSNTLSSDLNSLLEKLIVNKSCDDYTFLKLDHNEVCKEQTKKRR
ncbi:MAG: AAA family ATPase [bacterium]